MKTAISETQAAIRAAFDGDSVPSKNIALRRAHDRIAELERTIYEQAHIAATLGSGADGWLRDRLMSISNALNASIGRTQSSHGDQFSTTGKANGA